MNRSRPVASPRCSSSGRPGFEERHLAGIEPVDLALVDVEAEHLVAEFDHRGGVGGAEVAGADDSEFHACSCSVRHDARTQYRGSATPVDEGGQGGGGEVKLPVGLDRDAVHACARRHVVVEPAEADDAAVGQESGQRLGGPVRLLSVVRSMRARRLGGAGLGDEDRLGGQRVQTGRASG